MAVIVVKKEHCSESLRRQTKSENIIPSSCTYYPYYQQLGNVHKPSQANFMSGFHYFNTSNGRCPCPANSHACLTFLCFMMKIHHLNMECQSLSHATKIRLVAVWLKSIKNQSKWKHELYLMYAVHLVDRDCSNMGSLRERLPKSCQVQVRIKISLKI